MMYRDIPYASLSAGSSLIADGVSDSLGSNARVAKHKSDARICTGLTRVVFGNCHADEGA